MYNDRSAGGEPAPGKIDGFRDADAWRDDDARRRTSVVIDAGVDLGEVEAVVAKVKVEGGAEFARAIGEIADTTSLGSTGSHFVEAFEWLDAT